jgi:hypothetical protein
MAGPDTAEHANRRPFALATCCVLILGAVEGWFGKTAAGDVYGSDAIQYLDIARAFARHDWRSALNPLWSQGYPALLALIRPAFPSTPDGEWLAIHALNLVIFLFSWLMFAAFVSELLRDRERYALTLYGALFAFITAQLCIDQVSRVGPDQLVAAFIFLACTLLLRMFRNPSFGLSLLLGLTLGLGFLTKSIFLPLGCIALLIAAASLVRNRRNLALVLPAAALFAGITVTYGTALSRATGTRTLGEAGSLNYAWHVDRLAKWVHWEGGIDPASKAWPKPFIARFAHWDTDPPDFGTPVHPSQIVGSAPAIYVFHAPVEATYVPYFDPPYFYQGYRHILRWRYQVIALAKNLGDLIHVIVVQPLYWSLALIAIPLWLLPDIRTRILDLFPGYLSATWPVCLLALAGIAIYLPVHLEGRYLSAFLAILLVLKFDAISLLCANSPARRVLALIVFSLGFVTGLVKDQHEVWSRAAHLWNYRNIPEWREGEALRAAGLAPRAQIAVIAWSPNVQCDWAYLANVRIVSEIASPSDEKAFWSLTPSAQQGVIARFQQAGATAIVTRDQPPTEVPGWHQLPNVPVWLYPL